MSTTIIQSRAEPVDLSFVVHHMPCNIACTGEAPVSDFFLPTIRKNKLSCAENPEGPWKSTENPTVHYTAAFRGRPLNGTQLTLSPNYTGLILDEVSLNENSILNLKAGSKKQADWNVVGKFDAMSYWNWDKIPSDGDGMPQLLQWARLAEAAQTSARDLMPVGEDFIDSDTETS